MKGFDWNGNGYRDVSDSYFDYEIMNDKGHVSSGKPQRSNSKLNKKDEEYTHFLPPGKREKILFNKSVILLAFCIGGLVIPLSFDMGELGIAFCLIAFPLIGVEIFNTDKFVAFDKKDLVNIEKTEDSYKMVCPMCGSSQTYQVKDINLFERIIKASNVKMACLKCHYKWSFDEKDDD